MEVNFIKIEGQKSVNPHNQEHSKILQKQMFYLDTPRNRAWYKVLLAASSFRNGVQGAVIQDGEEKKEGKPVQESFTKSLLPLCRIREVVLHLTGTLREGL